MEEVDIPDELQRVQIRRTVQHDDHQLLLGRQKLIATKEKPGMALWREKLFAWMLKSSESAMEFFRLPINRVIELGSQVQI